MKVLLLSDIHGNLEALDAVLHDALPQKYKEIWFLGDLCGYGPEPEACRLRLLEEKTIPIAGNHDLYMGGRLQGSHFSSESRKSLLLSRALISKTSIEWLKLIPVRQQKKGFHLVHGSMKDPSLSYILNSKDALENFKLCKRKNLIFGHSHIQEVYLQNKYGISHIRPESGETISYTKNKILINPGSVGQPRDKDPRAAWALLDTKKKEVQFFRTSYNHEMTSSKILALGFSNFLAERLSKGE